MKRNCDRLRQIVEAVLEERPPVIADGGTEIVDSIGDESDSTEPPESDESAEMDEVESGVESGESDSTELPESDESAEIDEVESGVESDESDSTDLPESDETDVSEKPMPEEPLGGGGLEPAEAVQNLDTYSIEEEGYRFQTQSMTESGGDIRYVVVVYREGHQGPVYRGSNLPDNTADALGITRSLQDRLNRVVGEANRQVEMPKALKTSDATEVGELEQSLSLSK